MNHCISITNYNGIYCTFNSNYKTSILQFTASCNEIANIYIAICCNLQHKCNDVLLQRSAICNELLMLWIERCCTLHGKCNHIHFNFIQLWMQCQWNMLHFIAFECKCQTHRCTFTHRFIYNDNFNDSHQSPN